MSTNYNMPQAMGNDQNLSFDLKGDGNVVSIFKDTMGLLILGLLALIMLAALLRSQAHNRALQEQLRAQSEERQVRENPALLR